MYNLIQNTLHEFLLETEEPKKIKSLELLWPLLQAKNIISMLAKHITSSDEI